MKGATDASVSHCGPWPGPELAGTRITVYDVYHYLEAGRSPLYIAALLGLSTREVDFLIAYIEVHREDVLKVHQQIEARIARGHPPEVEALRKETRKELLALRDKLQQARQEKEAAHERNSTRS